MEFFSFFKYSIYAVDIGERCFPFNQIKLHVVMIGSPLIG
jgi:hypothetical protein